MASNLPNPQFLVNTRGQRKSVLLRLSEYEKLLRHLEDLEDALELDQAVRTAKRFRDYADIRAELQKAGRL